jgi:hypothetical protein
MAPPCPEAAILSSLSWSEQCQARHDYDACAMRIFLTGATGYVGSTVLDALLRSSHDVTALVRDPEKVEQFSQRGVHPVLGDLSVPAS